MTVRRAGQAGFTLVEAMVALSLLMIAALAIGRVVTASALRGRAAWNLSESAAAAASAIETRLASCRFAPGPPSLVIMEVNVTQGRGSGFRRDTVATLLPC